MDELAQPGNTKWKTPWPAPGNSTQSIQGVYAIRVCKMFILLEYVIEEIEHIAYWSCQKKLNGYGENARSYQRAYKYRNSLSEHFSIPVCDKPEKRNEEKGEPNRTERNKFTLSGENNYKQLAIFG